MNLPLVFKKIKELQQQGSKANPTDAMVFNVWNIKGELLIDSKNDTHPADYTIIALKDKESIQMNEFNKIRVSIHPTASINEAVRILEYVTDLLKDEGTNWKGNVGDVWDTIGGDIGDIDAPIIKECTRCGYVWEPKKGVPPKVCPKCKSYKWNIPK